MIRMPEYVDGILDVYRIEQDTSNDFPQEILEKSDLELFYREVSVFDRTKYELEQGGKEITLKIRIPQCRGIDSKCACEINGEMHLVYNATHVFDKNGFPETELTLIRPGKELRRK